ncbi:sulfate ABC transporter substrate-binding protein [Salipiger sp.]|uniref:sulfate ABC transporter substrate-binding protein n=1 Tax=Salipiger sp. TaxID=2078585 RepID=UPI003A96910F
MTHARFLRATTLAAALAVGGALAGPLHADTRLLNVSYDPTREFYRDYNAMFSAWWQQQGHPPVTIEQSHGGSGAQARAVIDGLDAQVVTLALASDIDAIADNSKAVPADWEGKLAHNSAPYTSTIVFLVREGNPKGISDWGDLIAGDVQVVTPNPKTSGGARWNFLAAWGWALKQPGGTEDSARAFVTDLYKHVPVLDTGARGATTTFTQRGVGDVLLAWENEAFLALDELGDDKFDIVVPSISILAEPPVALVEGNIRDEEQRAAAQGYLEHLYSPEAQALALRHYYRARDTSAATDEDINRFPALDLVTIADFGGWTKAQPAFFGEGGVFDQIYSE